MKRFTYLFMLIALLVACDDSEELKNSIDFSSPYVLEDSDDPIQHRRYEIFQKYQVPVFFNDTISRSYAGDDYAGEPMYRYETLDLNWEFSSQSYGSILYEFQYLTTAEEQNRALDFAESFLSRATGAMRPFCILLTDTVTVVNASENTAEKPVYLSNFRTLVLSQMQDCSVEEIDSLSSDILRSMVTSRVLQNSNLVARFGSVSSTDHYYDRYWVDDGSNDGLGCSSSWFTIFNGIFQISPNTCFNETNIEQVLSNPYVSPYLPTREDYEEVRSEMLLEIGQFGFISGDTNLSRTKSPSSVDADLNFYLSTLLEIGSAEFEARYGESPLVNEKYQMLIDYIENDLGVDLP